MCSTTAGTPVNGRIDVIDGTLRVTADNTARWAIVRVVDWPDDEKRNPSMRVELSDRRVIAGEMSPHYAQNRACQWVMEGT